MIGCCNNQIIIKHVSLSVNSEFALIFSVSNMVLTLISAIEVVLFPELKKVPQDKLQALYGSIERKLLIFMFGCFCFFYPLVSDIWVDMLGIAAGLGFMSIFTCIKRRKKVSPAVE